MTMLRLVVGQGYASRADILALSMKLATAAQELGLSVLASKASRNPGSSSRYLTLRDCRQQTWLIRISNHRMPVNSQHPLPHLDLVSLDGLAGLHEATVFLHSVTMGRAHWFDSTDPQYRRALRDQRRARAKNRSRA